MSWTLNLVAIYCSITSRFLGPSVGVAGSSRRSRAGLTFFSDSALPSPNFGCEQSLKECRIKGIHESRTIFRTDTDTSRHWPRPNGHVWIDHFQNMVLRQCKHCPFNPSWPAELSPLWLLGGLVFTICNGM